MHVRREMSDPPGPSGDAVGLHTGRGCPSSECNIARKGYSKDMISGVDIPLSEFFKVENRKLKIKDIGASTALYPIFKHE